MYTCVSLWVCTCGGVGGGWDVHRCEVVVVWVVVGMYTCVSLWVCTCGGVGGGWDVYICEVMDVYM